MGKTLHIFHYIEDRVFGTEPLHVYRPSRPHFTPQELLDAPIKEMPRPSRIELMGRKRGTITYHLPTQTFAEHPPEEKKLTHITHFPYPQAIREERGVRQQLLSLGGQGFGAIFDYRCLSHLLSLFSPSHHLAHSIARSPERDAMLDKMGRGMEETLEEAMRKSAARVREIAAKHGLVLPNNFPEK